MSKPKFLREITDLLHVRADSSACVIIQQAAPRHAEGQLDETIVLARDGAIGVQQALAAWLNESAPAAGDDEKVAVMLGDTDSGVPLIILAMGQAAWDYCKDGKTHTFDLSSAGLPVQLMIAGGPTRAGVVELVRHGIEQGGGTMVDGKNPNADLGIKSRPAN